MHKLLACGRCRHHFYCSAECQKEDWDSHKSMFCMKLQPSRRLLQLQQAVTTAPLLMNVKCVDVNSDKVLQCALEICRWNVEAACFLLSLVATRSYTQLPWMMGNVGKGSGKEAIKQFLGGLEILFGWKVSGKRLHQLETLLGIKEEVSNYLTKQEEEEEKRRSWLATALPVVDKIFEGLRPMMFLVHLCYSPQGEIVGDKKRKKILDELLEVTHRSCRENVEGCVYFLVKFKRMCVCVCVCVCVLETREL